VALEVLVNATGAKASEKNGARDLFSEETTTVLVFKDGAVIRLQAPVSVGQLLFLTNKKSNQEVVSQVLKKRCFKPGSNYVELLFTEERPDYWGVTFPEEKMGTAEFKVEEQVQAEETTAEEPDTPVAPHSAEDVDRLKKEVEVLREQLAALEKKNEVTAAAKVTAEAAAAREIATRDASMREAARAMEAMTGGALGGASKSKVELAPVNDPSPVTAKVEEPKPELLMPAAKEKEKQEAARPVVGMALPLRKQESKKPAEEPRDPVEDLLPKPELDFSQVPKGAAQGQAGGLKSLGASKMGNARVMGLSAVLLLALVGGAWYGKWRELLPIGNHAVAAPVKRPAPARSTPVAATAKTAVPVGTSAAGGNSAAGNDSLDAGNAAKSGSNGANAETDGAKPPANEAAPVEKTPSWRERFMGKKSEEKAPEQPSAAETVASDAPEMPAKLLKAANPVYPPDAMRSYITGDVKAEVVVEASGRVGEVKVLSGPQALREAAVDALKQYEYAPATQGGKAVKSKTEAVVKFWFNP
jgi:TonB family protein